MCRAKSAGFSACAWNDDMNDKGAVKPQMGLAS